MNRDIFLKPPKEANASGLLWRLKKPVYGLADAPRQWYDRVRFEMLKSGCVQSTDDGCIFTYKESGICTGIILVHVDDFWWSGNDNFHQAVVVSLKHVFLIKSEYSLPLRYLGLNIDKSSNGVCHINQNDCLESLSEIHQNGHSTDELLSEREVRDVRGALGKLLWLAVQSMPAIGFEISWYSSNLRNLCKKDTSALNMLIRSVKSQLAPILAVPNVGTPSEWRLVAFCDSSLNNYDNGSTHAGYLVFLCNKTTKQSCLLSWQSSKFRRIVKSTLDAETLAAVNVADAAYYCQKVLFDILGHKIPIIEVTDSKSVFCCLLHQFNF